MTSEAKIGLLLGLVFIFIIAFIINGLPSFWHKSDGNELTVAAENPQDVAAGIGVNERKAGETIEKVEPAAASNTGPVVVETQGNSNVRFAAELPKDGTNAATKAELQPVTVAQALPPEENGQTSDVQTTMPAEQQTYVVCSGDSLYTIAKKFYGASEAGKKSTTDLIFNANRSVLKSPRMLRIGQKLVIPSLSAKQTSHKVKVENVPVNVAQTQSTQAGESEQNVVVSSNQTKQTRDYVIKSGDSLWKIAAKQLGNGNRFEEIASINSDILQDNENLTVGTHLKLPAR